MIRLPNDESEIAESPLLIISEPEMRRCPNINNVTTDAEFELVEGLLQEARKAAAGSGQAIRGTATGGPQAG